MAHVVKPLAGVEVMLLLAVVGTGLAVFITSLQSTNEIPNLSCIPYTGVTFETNPPVSWGNITFTPPSTDGKCRFYMATHIIAFCFAFVSALYRSFTICMEKVDFILFRLLSVPLYLLCALFALIASTVLQVGFNRFCDQLEAYKGSNGTCEGASKFIAGLADSPKSEFDFVDELNIASKASWFTMTFWFILTILSLVSYCAARRQRHTEIMRS